MMVREIQRKQSDLQELVNIKRNAELGKLQNLVNQAIKTIGKKQGFDLILYDGIAYTNNRLDITKSVLAYLKKAYSTKRSGFNK
jgi:outer membrane protein